MRIKSYLTKDDALITPEPGEEFHFDQRCVFLEIKRGDTTTHLIHRNQIVEMEAWPVEVKTNNINKQPPPRKLVSADKAEVLRHKKDPHCFSCGQKYAYCSCKTPLSYSEWEQIQL